MSILSEEIIEDLPITKEYLKAHGFDPRAPKKMGMFGKIKYKFKSFIKYKIWNRFYITDISDTNYRFCVSIVYDRVTSTLYIIYKPTFKTYLNCFPRIILRVEEYPEDIDGSNDELIVIEKHTNINTQYFLDILFANIFSDSKCKEIIIWFLYGVNTEFLYYFFKTKNCIFLYISFIKPTLKII